MARKIYFSKRNLAAGRLFAAADLPIGFLRDLPRVLAYGNCGIRHSKDIDVLVDANVRGGIQDRGGSRLPTSQLANGI